MSTLATENLTMAQASGQAAVTAGDGASTSMATPLKTGASGSSQRGRDWRHLSRLFEALPPHAIEAEMSLLGSILLDPQVLGDVIFIVKRGEDFFKSSNGALYDAMVEIYDRHSSLDIVQLNQLLVDRNVLEAVGGQSYLIELASCVPSAGNARHYARLVREKAMIRQLIGAAGDILHDAYVSPEQAQVVLDQAEARIFAIAQQSDHTPIENLADLVDLEVRHYQDNEHKLLTGTPSGFHQLDELTTGFQKAEMIIIAARPSMGKTALALNMAENMAIRGKRVGFFSLEMSKQQLAQRLLCARAGVESQRFRRAMLNDQEFQAVIRACDELQHAPIFVDDTPGLTSLQMRTKGRRMAQKHKVDVIFIDYLQLLTSGRRAESRQVEVSDISRGVKALARELNIPVICLSQLNRGPEDRTGNKPRMSDLRESGSLEQDADVIALLHREDYYHQGDDEWRENNPDKIGVAELIIAKQRNGPTGTVEMSWHAGQTRFRDYHPEPRGYVAEPKSPGPGASSGAGPGAGARPPIEPSRQSQRGVQPSSRRTGPVENFRDGGGPERDDTSGGAATHPGEADDEFDGVPI
jgi:replicative DNA helicase